MKHLLIILSTLLISYIVWSIFVLLISPLIGDNHKEENGEPNGFGVTIGYPDSGDWYVGEWKDGELNGKGKLTIYNEGEYIGDWKDGIKHGQGTYNYYDGEKYEGEWKDGEWNGQGTWTMSKGKKKVGEWRKLPLGIPFLWKGTYYHEDGTIISKWKYGTRVKQ